jgi:hypothetical protein
VDGSAWARFAIVLPSLQTLFRLEKSATVRERSLTAETREVAATASNHKKKHKKYIPLF